MGSSPFATSSQLGKRVNHCSNTTINFLQILKVIGLKHNSEMQEVHWGPKLLPLGAFVRCTVVSLGGWRFIAARAMHM